MSQTTISSDVVLNNACSNIAHTLADINNRRQELTEKIKRLDTEAERLIAIMQPLVSPTLHGTDDPHLIGAYLGQVINYLWEQQNIGMSGELVFSLPFVLFEETMKTFTEKLSLSCDIFGVRMEQRGDHTDLTVVLKELDLSL